MTYLILGLIIFLGVHSVRIVADDWRTRTLAQVGEGVWKGVYSLLAFAGLGLIIWGFGLARQMPVMLWMPPVGMRHAAALFTLIAFVLLAAAYVPGNHIKARLHHPMAGGVKVWAFGHLLATGSLAHVVLFGSFLIWAVLAYLSGRRRDRAQGTVYPAGTVGGTVTTVVVGVVAWAVFAFLLHGLLIGIRPIG